MLHVFPVKQRLLSGQPEGDVVESEKWHPKVDSRFLSGIGPEILKMTLHRVNLSPVYFGDDIIFRWFRSLSVFSAPLHMTTFGWYL